MIDTIWNWFTTAFVIILIILLGLIFLLAVVSMFRKLRKDGIKSVDEWNEIQALTNLGVIISFFFVIFSFFNQKSESKENEEKYKSEIFREDAMFSKGHEINLVNYEYYRWEHLYDSKLDILNIWSYKTTNNLNYNCFDLTIKPIFKNKLTNISTSSDLVDPIMISYSCNQNNVNLKYDESKIEISISRLYNSVYNFLPKTTQQVEWLDKSKHKIIGYNVELMYYPSLARNNICNLEGDILNDNKGIFSNIKWR